MKAPQSASDLLRDLIAIPSVNPDGDPGTELTGELACAQYVAAFLESCGAEVTLEEVEPDRPNVIGRFPCENPENPTLLLGPHTDTVGVGGMTIDPFGAELRDGRIWGRGASDTKGSMASMLWALRELKDEIPKLGARVVFAGFMSEESGQFGSRHFAEHHGSEIDFAIVGEPTRLDVVYAHKACWWVEITTHGKAAHGSRPELGENAVLRMVDILQAIDEDFDSVLENYPDDVLGVSSLSVNMCHGGTRSNIVPDSCRAVLDIRATPALHDRDVIRELEAFLTSRGMAPAEFRATAKCPALRTDPADPFVLELVEMGSNLVDAPWFCDAGWLSEAGISAVALGPGSIEQAHTKDEWISVEDLEAGARYFRNFLRNL